MKKSTIFSMVMILILGSCNGSATKTNMVPDSTKLHQDSLYRTIHSNDSNKTIYYESDGNVYRSQFYNTTQALVRGSMDNPYLNRLFTQDEINYLTTDDLPTMDELQNAMRILTHQDTFWDTTASDPIWDDCKYLAANTKYWRIYYTSKTEQEKYVRRFENNHHFISRVKYDLTPISDSMVQEIKL